jgi:4-amino-4-deoxy-L-arabinose transferase-like glycosyltransferase
MFARGWHSLGQKSATYDEWGHLGNGIAFLTCGDQRFPMGLGNLINPPLARALAALPIRTEGWEEVVSPKPRSSSCPEEMKLQERLAAFPFKFDIDSIGILERSRLMVLLFSLLGIPLLFLLARELEMPRAGPWAALAYACSPNIMAHARLITPDLPVSILILATMLAWLRLARSPCWSRTIVAAVVLGLSLATKYSAILMIPILGLVVLLGPNRKKLRVFWLSAVAGILACLVFVAIYAGMVLPPFRHMTLAVEYGEEVEKYIHFMKTWLGRNLVMPFILYRYGAIVAGRAVMKSFLLGHHAFEGWLSYFPIAIATKTPLAILLALSFGLGWGLRQRTRVSGAMLWVAALPTLYMVVTLGKGIQVGLRHILPVYPFLSVVVGSLLAVWWTRGGKLKMVSAVLASCVILEGISIHPHYLANFNLAAGGPDKGHTYLVDCNLDWGQDLPALAEYQHRNEIKHLYLSYFGTDVPDRYGIEYKLICTPVGRTKPPPGVYALSATDRQGLYDFPKRMNKLAWFRNNPPTCLVAHTIFVYDLR